MSSIEDENEDGQSSITHNDEDSDISFESDTDDEIDTTEIKEEDWIEYIARSTDEAIDKMEDAKIMCWIKTHKRMKWRMALRIASLPNERWMVKAAEWNPGLSSRYRTYRAIGRARKRWEDDINEFLKLEETEIENSTESDNKYNKTWIKAAKDHGRWTLLEENNTEYAVTRTRRNSHDKPARYVNGVKLSDEEIANIKERK